MPAPTGYLVTSITSRPTHVVGMSRGKSSVTICIEYKRLYLGHQKYHDVLKYGAGFASIAYSSYECGAHIMSVLAAQRKLMWESPARCKATL